MMDVPLDTRMYIRVGDVDIPIVRLVITVSESPPVGEYVRQF